MVVSEIYRSPRWAGRACALAVACGGLFWGSLAQAQPVGLRSAPDHLRTERLSPAAGADLVSQVRVLDAEEIGRMGARYIADVLRVLPGVWVTSDGGAGGATRVRLRGSAARDALVLIDDVRVDAGPYGAGFDWGRINTQIVERIEVAYGGQGALWGSGAGSGVINVITRPEGEGGFEFAAQAEGGFNFASPAVGFRAVNRSRAFNFSADFAYDSTRDHDLSRGQAEGLHSQDPAEDTEDDDHTLTNAGLSFSVRRVDGFELGILARRYNDKAEYDEADLRRESSPDYGLPYDVDGEATRTGLLWRANAGFARPGAGLSLELAATAEDYEDRLEDLRTDSDRGERRATARGYLHTGGEKASLTLSGVTEWTQETAVQNSVERENDIAAYGGEARIELEDKVFISLALRRDDSDAHGSGDSYRIGMAYNLEAINTRITSNFARSLRFPTFADTFVKTPRFTPNPNLRNEITRTYDIGLEFTSPSKAASFAFVYFGTDTNDRVDYRNRLEPTTNPLNGNLHLIEPTNIVGKSHLRGWEASYSRRITNWLTADTSWTSLSARDPKGEALAGVPQDVGRVSLQMRGDDHELPLRLAINLTWAQDIVDYRYTNQTTRVLVPLSDTTRLDAHLETEFAPGVHAYMHFDNILNQDLTTRLGWRARGASVAIGLRARF